MAISVNATTSPANDTWEIFAAITGSVNVANVYVIPVGQALVAHVRTRQILAMHQMEMERYVLVTENVFVENANASR